MTNVEFLDDVEARNGKAFTQEERTRLYILAYGCVGQVAPHDVVIETTPFVRQARERANAIALKRLKEPA